ncbi:hypothetical protein INT45_002374 [Circinella minor]|uniref:Uncharacterized protein n=1 Tax=Circinella minor TaxID=1195481 RepID=A0A8H7VKP1_9FUNG|nr:hypothetical protein INT45_002374 [Circinella minor]
MDQTEWRKPYTTFHDYLHGSNSTLEQTVNNRSEIISIDDIRYAETEVIGKRLPEIESHLTKVQKGLDALEMEAKAMEFKVDEQAEQIKSLERQLQPNLSSTEQQHSQRKKPRLNKRNNNNNNSNNHRDNHSQNLQKKRKLLERELASLQTRIDQDIINYEEIKAQREAEEAKKQKEKQEEEKAATSSDRMDDHSPTRTNDQTMTTEDVHTLKQIKTLSKILLPTENSISISQLLDQHIKIDHNNEV